MKNFHERSSGSYPMTSELGNHSTLAKPVRPIGVGEILPAITHRRTASSLQEMLNRFVESICYIIGSLPVRIN